MIHTRAACEAGLIVVRLLGEDGVARAFGRQLAQQERIGDLVSAPARGRPPSRQHRRGPLGRTSSSRAPAAAARRAARAASPVSPGGAAVHPSSCEMTQSAMADGLPWPGRSTSSGWSGGS